MSHTHTSPASANPAECATCRQLLAALSRENLVTLRDLLLLLAASGTEVSPGAVELVEVELATRAG